MSQSLQFKLFFIGCVLGFTIAARLAIALPVTLLGPIGGLADVANELSLVIAVLVAGRLTERFKNYFDNRARRLVLEQGFVKWSNEIEARRAAAAISRKPLLKQVA